MIIFIEVAGECYPVTFRREDRHVGDPAVPVLVTASIMSVDMGIDGGGWLSIETLHDTHRPSPEAELRAATWNAMMARKERTQARR